MKAGELRTMPGEKRARVKRLSFTTGWQEERGIADAIALLTKELNARVKRKVEPTTQWLMSIGDEAALRQIAGAMPDCVEKFYVLQAAEIVAAKPKG